MKLPSNLSAIFVITLLVLGVGVIVWKNMGPGSNASTALVEVIVPKHLSGTALAGKKAFDKYCQRCHGQNGAGTDKGPPLVYDTYQPGHHPDESFFRAVKNGVQMHHWKFGNMPPRPEVSDKDVAEIVRYIRELQVANGIVWRPHRM